MERAARPATVEDLKQLIEHLNRESVDYLLIGGYALMALGYQRGTTDIDFAAAPRSRDRRAAQARPALSA